MATTRACSLRRDNRGSISDNRKSPQVSINPFLCQNCSRNKTLPIRFWIRGAEARRMTNPSCVHLFTDYIESPLFGQQSFTQILIKIIYRPPANPIEKTYLIVLYALYREPSILQKPHRYGVHLDTIFSRCCKNKLLTPLPPTSKGDSWT